MSASLSSYSDRDRAIGIGTIMGEALREGPDGMAAIADVIANRMEDPSFARYGQTIEGQAYRAREFSTWSKAEERAYDIAYRSAFAPDTLTQREKDFYSQAVEAFDSVFTNGTRRGIAQGATFYHNPAVTAKLGTNAFHNGLEKTYGAVTIGNHRFTGPNIGRPEAYTVGLTGIPEVVRGPDLPAPVNVTTAIENRNMPLSVSPMGPLGMGPEGFQPTAAGFASGIDFSGYMPTSAPSMTMAQPSTDYSIGPVGPLGMGPAGFQPSASGFASGVDFGGYDYGAPTQSARSAPSMTQQQTAPMSVGPVGALGMGPQGFQASSQSPDVAANLDSYMPNSMPSMTMASPEMGLSIAPAGPLGMAPAGFSLDPTRTPSSAPDFTATINQYGTAMDEADRARRSVEAQDMRLGMQREAQRIGAPAKDQSRVPAVQPRSVVAGTPEQALQPEEVPTPARSLPPVQPVALTPALRPAIRPPAPVMPQQAAQQQGPRGPSSFGSLGDYMGAVSTGRASAPAGLEGMVGLLGTDNYAVMAYDQLQKAAALEMGLPSPFKSSFDFGFSPVANPFSGLLDSFKSVFGITPAPSLTPAAQSGETLGWGNYDLGFEKSVLDSFNRNMGDYVDFGGSQSDGWGGYGIGSYNNMANSGGGGLTGDGWGNDPARG